MTNEAPIKKVIPQFVFDRIRAMQAKAETGLFRPGTTDPWLEGWDVGVDDVLDILADVNGEPRS